MELKIIRFLKVALMMTALCRILIKCLILGGKSHSNNKIKEIEQIKGTNKIFIIIIIQGLRLLKIM